MMNSKPTSPKGLLLEISMQLGQQRTNQEIFSTETNNNHEQLRKQFTLIQEMADSQADVISNTPLFNLNLGQLVLASAQKIHRVSNGTSFKKDLPIDLAAEFQKNQVFEIDIYNDLIVLTDKMLAGDYLFDDAYAVTKDDDDDQPFVPSDVLIDLAQNLRYLVPSADLVLVPKIEFRLVEYDLKTGKKGELGHEIDD